MIRDDFLIKQLRTLLEQVVRALGLLDSGNVEEAGELAEQTIDELTRSCGADWLKVDVSTLLSLLGKPERGRALARALWIGSSVDEAAGKKERARLRNRRAMELYARLRLGSEETDFRAARELAAASARLRRE